MLRTQHGESFREDRPTSSLPRRNTRRQNAGSEPAADFATSINIFLGRELVKQRFGIAFLSRRAMRARAQALLQQLDVHIPDLDVWVETLSGGQRQGVAIARALDLDADLIVMDEPTAALAVAEVRKVLSFIDRLRGRGKGVVLVSHNMQDVFAVADRVTVMRHGMAIAVRRVTETDPEEIVGLITGAARMLAAAQDAPLADAAPGARV